MVRTLHRALVGCVFAGLSGLVVAFAVPGCGSDDDNKANADGDGSVSPLGDGGGTTIQSDLVEACRAQALWNCQTLKECRAQDFAFASVEACTAAFAAGTCELNGSYGLDRVLGAGYPECQRRQTALGPSCLPAPTATEEDVLAARAACQPDKLVPPPTRAIGEACLSDVECPRSAVCHRADEKSCGVCTEVVEGRSCERRSECGAFTGFECSSAKTCTKRGEVGESCETKGCNPYASLVCNSEKKCAVAGRRDESCAVTACDTALFLYCSESSKTCKPLPRRVDDTCPDGVCGAGLYCSPEKKCAAVLEEGADCASIAVPNPCNSLHGLACDHSGSGPTAGKCALAFARVGEPCGESNLQPLKECWQSHCVGDTGVSPGRCVAYRQAGESCGGEEERCADFYLCTGGVCRTAAEALATLDGGLPDAASTFQGCLP